MKNITHSAVQALLKPSKKAIILTPEQETVYTALRFYLDALYHDSVTKQEIEQAIYKLENQDELQEGE